MGLSDFQIRLAVQVSGLYEGHTLWLRRWQHDQISGEESVVVNLCILKRAILAKGCNRRLIIIAWMILAKTGNLNHIADGYGAPLYPLPVPIPQHLHQSHVYFIVRSVPLLKIGKYFSFIRVMIRKIYNTTKLYQIYVQRPRLSLLKQIRWGWKSMEPMLSSVLSETHLVFAKFKSENFNAIDSTNFECNHGIHKTDFSLF